MQAVLSCTPTFTLRGVDPLQILQQYLDGDFTKITDIPSKVTAAKSTTLITQGYGADVNSEVYVYRDKNNNQQTIVTTNHDAYSCVRDGKDYRPKRCRWCRRKFTQERDPVGIPTAYLKDHEGKYIFYTDQPNFDTFECALACLRRTQKIRLYKDSLYMDSEQFLKLFCKVATGVDDLQEAKDWILYHKNGGHLTDKEYFQNTHTYRRTSNIVCLPIKVAYSQQSR